MPEVIDILWKAAGFVVAMSILVCVHEYGHYWVARRCGIKVLRFSLGMGTPWKSFVARDGVEWSIGPWPIGGYVKMLDTREGSVLPHEEHLAFDRQSVPKRLAVLFAGPVANFLLAILLYWSIFMIGVDSMKSVIASPPPDTVAAQVGLKRGEQVTAVDGEQTPTWPDLRLALIDHAFDTGPLRLEVKGEDGAFRTVAMDLAKVRRDPQYLFDDLGLDEWHGHVEPVLGDIVPDSAAQSAGLQRGDRVLSVNGTTISEWSTMVYLMRSHPAEVVKLRIQRRSQELEVSALLASENDNGRVIGRLGATNAMPPVISDEMRHNLRAERRLGPLEAVPAAAGQVWQMAQLTVRILYRMVVGDVSVKNISGPIQIAQVAGITAQIGLVPFLSFLAVISVSIGLINLVPIPVLDGGQIVMYTIEGIKGRPLSQLAQRAAMNVGLALVGMLMMVALYNDIMRLV